MTRWIQTLTFLLLASFVVPMSIIAQEEPESARKEQPALATKDNSLEGMSGAVTSMAEMCQMMMRQEMANRPIKMAAAWGLGVLSAVILVLLAVLEIQWIRLCNIRIHNERTDQE